MSSFKGTKGKWMVDPQSRMVKCEDQSIATAWSMNTSHLDDRLNGECWLDMRNRTKEERDILDIIIPRANALLISKAPEMLEMLEEWIRLFENVGELKEEVEKSKQLIKEATEL